MDGTLDVLKEHFSKKMIHLNEDDMSTSDFISRSSNPTQNPRNIPRYHKRNVSEKFSYIPDFFSVLERCLFQIPDGLDVFDENFGYAHPSQNQININSPDSNEENSYFINKSKQSTDQWVDEIIRKILRNHTIGKPIYHPIVDFILGKIGSGKSTYVKYIEHGFNAKFHNQGILFVPIQHTQIMHAADIGVHANKLDKGSLLVKIRDVILKNIVYQFKRSALLRNKFISVKFFMDGFRRYCATKGISISENDIKFEENFLHPSNENYIISIDAFVKYLISERIHFLIAIDGLDIFSFDEVTKGKYSELFSVMSSLLFGTADPSWTIPHTNFIVTLRHCTYERFVVNHIEQIRHISPSYILPCDFNTVLRRGVMYCIQFQKKNLPFWAGKEKLLLSFYESITDILKRSFGINDEDEISEKFDNNHRKILESEIEISYWIISKVTQKNNFDNVFSAIEYIIDNNLLSTKSSNRYDRHDEHIDQYDILETYIIRDSVGFFNRFSVGDRLIQTPRGANIDNIFNYHMVDSSTSDVSNFLLLKFRILQFLIHRAQYTSVELIKKFLKDFGYDLTDKELSVNIDLLHSDRFIKIRNNANNDMCYSITEFGRIFSNNIVWSTRYMENAIQESLIPNVIRHDFIGCIKYMSKISTNQWIENSIINMYLFLQIVINIEEQEKKSINPAKFNVHYRKFSPFISGKISSEVLHFIEIIARDSRVDLKRVVDEIKKITAEYLPQNSP